MVERATGDILQADVEALVNTVNCVGVMGRGIALQFRKAFPDNFEEYKRACDAGKLRPGHILVHEHRDLHNPRFIMNFPTKRHWKGKSRLEYIEAGLKSLVKEIKERNIESVAIPPLGCGLGGLDWSEVRPRIFDAFRDVANVRVVLYEPAGAPAAAEMPKTAKTPKMTVGRAALLGLMRRYLSAILDPSVTLLEVHKLMYFMQESGEPLRLRYQKGLYGPYAENLRHVLTAIEGHFISGYGDAEDRPDLTLEILGDASEKAEDFLEEHELTRARFERVTRLIDGFETAFGMELLSTVHWVATQEKASSADEAVELTHSWNERKLMYEPRHIRLAWDRLAKQGWLTTSQ